MYIKYQGERNLAMIKPCFKERLEKLPPDFYFNNTEHFFNTCTKIVRELDVINPQAIAQSLKFACSSLFYFAASNLDTISSLKLRYPTDVFALNLRYVTDLQSLISTIGAYKEIETNYSTMFEMDLVAIYESQYRQYIDSKKFIHGNSTTHTKEEKVKHIDTYINCTFNSDHYHINRNKLNESLCELMNMSGVYRLYDFDHNLVYIGKSYNLASRIPTSLKERKAFSFDYTSIPNKADTDIYAVYYIALLQPPLNSASNSGDTPNVKLRDLDFIDIVDVYEEKSKGISLIQDGRALITYETEEELLEYLEKLRLEYEIVSMSKPKVNEFAKDGNEYILTTTIKKLAN